jgi:hypothetical protein
MRVIVESSKNAWDFRVLVGEEYNFNSDQDLAPTCAPSAHPTSPALTQQSFSKLWDSPRPGPCR